MDEWMDAWMHGCMDAWIAKEFNLRSVSPIHHCAKGVDKGCQIYLSIDKTGDNSLTNVQTHPCEVKRSKRIIEKMGKVQWRCEELDIFRNA